MLAHLHITNCEGTALYDRYFLWRIQHSNYCGCPGFPLRGSRHIAAIKLDDLRGNVDCLAASVARGRISPRLEMGNDDRHAGPALCSDKLAPALLRRPNSLVALPLPILTCLTVARLSQLCTKVAGNVQLSSAQNPEI